MTIRSYGYDVNQIGTSDYPRIITRELNTQRTGLVVDVVTNHKHDEYIKSNGRNFGYAKIKLLPGDEDSNNNALNWIAPKDINIQFPPQIDEEVLVEYIGGTLMYSRTINRENQVSGNISVAMNAVFNSDPNKQNTQDIDSEIALSGVRINNNAVPTKTSAFIPSVLPIAPEEGDFILQGRYGHSIRFGSSRFLDDSSYPLPNMLLSVGQPATPESISTDERTSQSLVYEDVITNAASIWMVTDQLVPFQPAAALSENSEKAFLRGSEIVRDKFYYTGPQIFVDSDRVVLNSKEKEIQLFAKSEINLSAINSITIASERNVDMTSNLDIKLKSLEADVFIRGKNNVSLISENGDITGNANSGNYVIWGKQIFIGSGGDTSQPMVLGGQLSVFLQELLIALQLLPTVYLPQPSPTAATAALQIASTVTKLLTDVSTLQGASFNSVSNFTAKENK